MCTLIAGLGVLGPGTLLLGANRDESPGRPSAGPARLLERPPVVGGRDLVVGGTWLAIREGRFVAALLNRRPPAAWLEGGASDPASFRSRGLLCLDAVAAPPGFDAPATIDPATAEPYPARLDSALRIVGRDRYAPCSLVGLEAGGGPSWVVSIPFGEAPRATLLEPGWHVITHQEMDDPEEPRTRALLERLRDERPRDVEDGLELLKGLLREHGDGGAWSGPAVCLHRERFPTVSSTLLALGVGGEAGTSGDAGPSGGARYLHAGGPPCVTPYEDFSPLFG